MKDGTKYLITALVGLLAYPLIIFILTPIFSLHVGFAELNAQTYHDGIVAVILSIILLGIVMCFCTYEIISAIKKVK